MPHPLSTMDRLEREPETQLECPRGVRYVQVLRRKTVGRTNLCRGVRTVVCMVEHVEYLNCALDSPITPKPEPLLQPEVYPVERFSHQIVPGHDRAIRTEPISNVLSTTQIRAKCRSEAFP